MNLFARLADHGPVRAAMVTVSLFLAGLVLTLLGPFAGLLTLFAMIASCAVIAYVTLRRGLPAAVRTLGYSVLALTLFSLLLFRSVLVLPLVALLMWVPVMLPAVVLLRTVSLPLAMLSIVAIGVVAVLGVSVAPGLLTEIQQQLVSSVTAITAAQGTELTAEQAANLQDYLVANLPVFLGVSAMFTPLASLLLARSWHAVAVNPGGFRQEFHGLQLGRYAAIACVASVALAMLLDNPLWNGVAAIWIVAFVIQGLSVCHAVVAQRGLSKGWLVGVYLLMPLSGTLLVLGAVGLVDNFRRLRKI